MRIGIADPPYLGRAARWYGAAGRGNRGGHGRADQHAAADVWDTPTRHVELVAELRASFDAWAIACAPDSLSTYLTAAPDARILVWHRRNAPPSGARIRACWEAVLVWTPRVNRSSGLALNDVLDHPSSFAPPGTGFAGAKPPAWTRWVLDALGYVEATDTVVDLFPGSGAVSLELAQGTLELPLTARQERHHRARRDTLGQNGHIALFGPGASLDELLP